MTHAPRPDPGDSVLVAFGALALIFALVAATIWLTPATRPSPSTKETAP